MKVFSLLTLVTMILLVIPVLVFGQSTLRGTVTDSTTNEALIGANVYLQGTALGGITDREGKYKIVGVPQGMFTLRISYIGYKPRDFEITLRADETREVSGELIPDVLEGEEVLVTAQARGQVAAINQQINANTIVNVISEEKIKELPDANAAEAIGRLPGVSLIRSGGEANKVILRGMGDKFTAFTIDGVRIPPTDANERGVDLSMFSQGTLAGVELFKALTPDKDADAIAGSINLVTRKAPSTRLIRVDAKGAYNRLDKTADQYDFNGKYGERFFDDVLGVQVNGNIERRDRSNEQFDLDIDGSPGGNYNDWEYSDFTLGYTNEVRKRGGVGILLDVNTPDDGSIRFNNLFSQTNRNYILYSRDYPTGGTYVFYGAWDREQKISTLNNSVHGENHLLTFDFTWGLSFAQSKTDFPFDYRMYIGETPSNDSTNPSGMRPLPESILKGPPELFIPYAYNNFGKSTVDTAFFRTHKNEDREKTVFLDIARKYTASDLLSGELKFGGKYRHKNRFKASDETIARYDLGYFQDYTRNSDGTIQRKNFEGTRFANLQLSGRQVLMTNFLDPNPPGRNIFDKYGLFPLINRDALREWYELNKNGVSTTGQLEYNANPEARADYYDIAERVSSAYLMNTFNYGTLLTFIAGVRVEAENNDYLAKYTSQALSGFPTTGALLDTTANFKETIWLPNFHLTVRPLDFMNVRLAAYRAIARPDFSARLLKLVARITNPRDIVVAGNPQLKNAKSWNFEINTSFFGNDIGLLSISAFYREIKDMFHTVSEIPGTYEPDSANSVLNTLGIGWRVPIPVHSPFSLTYSVNSAQPTKVWGFEFEHQANLHFLPGFLSNTVLSYNLSVIRSETFVLSYRVDTTYVIIPPFPVPFPRYSTALIEAKQKLEGQPEFFGNFAIGYDVGGFSGRLSVFFQGEYNRLYSASRRSDPVVKDFSRWDLTLRQRLTQNISVFFNLNNFTSVEENSSTANRVVGWEALKSNQKYGLTSDLGVRFEF